MPPIQDAQTDDEGPELPAEFPPLKIGDPFALSEGLELLERVPLDRATIERAAKNGMPGCVATVKCDGPEGQPCGAVFRIDLVQPGVKNCPRCKVKYTSVLIVAPVEDDDILAEAMQTIMRSNGYEMPGAGGDDDDEAEYDDDDDDDEGGELGEAGDDQGDDEEDEDRAAAREHFHRNDDE